MGNGKWMMVDGKWKMGTEEVRKMDDGKCEEQKIGRWEDGKWKMGDVPRLRSG